MEYERRECPYCKRLVNVLHILSPTLVEEGSKSYVYDEERFQCMVCGKEFVLPEQYERNAEARHYSANLHLED